MGKVCDQLIPPPPQKDAGPAFASVDAASEPPDSGPVIVSAPPDAGTAVAVATPVSCGNVPGSLLLIILLLFLAAYIAKQELEKRKAERKKLEKAKAEQKKLAEAEAEKKKLEVAANCLHEGYAPGKFCGKCGTKVPDLPTVAPSTAAPADAPVAPETAKPTEAPPVPANLVTRDELKGMFDAFLEHDVEARVLAEKSAAFSVMLATEEQILGKLEATDPPDKVEIDRVKARIGNLDFLKKEAEATADRLLTQLKKKKEEGEQK